MKFMDAYKNLEWLCSDVMGESHGVSAYIEAMKDTPNGSYIVSEWDEDLKQLKHYRWIRNQIVHEPGCTEENMCTPSDVAWLIAFRGRILNRTDPLALYRNAMQPRPKPQPKKYAPTPTSEKNRNRGIALVDALIWGLVIAIVVLFLRLLLL